MEQKDLTEIRTELYQRYARLKEEAGVFKNKVDNVLQLLENMEERVKDAKEKGYEEGRSAEQAISNPAVAYEKGMEDIWEVLTDIVFQYSTNEKEEIFESHSAPSIGFILRNMKPTDVVEKVRNYKLKKVQKESIVITNEMKFVETYGALPTDAYGKHFCPPGKSDKERCRDITFSCTECMKWWDEPYKGGDNNEC